MAKIFDTKTKEWREYKNDGSDDYLFNKLFRRYRESRGMYLFIFYQYICIPVYMHIKVTEGGLHDTLIFFKRPICGDDKTAY